MRSSRRKYGHILLAALALVLALTTTAAGPAGQPRQPARHGGGEAPFVAVTLVTGDHVRLDKSGKGSPGVTVTPGPGRENVTFSTRYAGEHVYVVPADAAAALAEHRLDWRLFDIAGLVEDGYADDVATTLPLIVRPAPGRSLAAAPKSASVRRALPGIQAEAVALKKQTATTYWRWLVETNGVQNVWLDGKVRATLDQSVPQTGAPTAWANGLTGNGIKVAVLDTGVDRTHPDLEQAVEAERDFTQSQTGPTDAHGHGTHVASIVTGSGAADKGTYKGMAPDATIINAKVLNDDGNGYESDVIAGAEWAIGQGAKVLNLSLGGDPSDGTDPLSLAVNDISASTGALFVVAAGNDYSRGSINTPGAADAALTVGATDRDATTADFSSRGPRAGDGAVKPDIAAPGVGIAAAKAEGSTLGEPVGEFYQRLSGTSMATPHVAGAAAILAQQHPDWNGHQLKAALASTAKPGQATSIYEQGAGLLDVAQAISQTTVPDQASLSLFLKWPQQTQPITRALTYRNTGTATTTLALTTDTTTTPAGYLTLDDDELTIPAGGQASVTVTVDPSKGTPGTTYEGRLTATAPGVAIQTPISVLQEQEAYDVKVRLIDRTGRVIQHSDDQALVSPALLEGVDRVRYVGLFSGDAYLHARVTPGRYTLTTGIRSPDNSVTVLSQPKIVVDRDQTITLDARQANPVTVTVDRQETPGRAVIGVLQQRDDPDYYIAGTLIYTNQTKLYALETEHIDDRDAIFYYKQILDFQGGRYDLLLGRGDHIPADPAYTLHDSDLARLDLDFSNPGVQHGGLWTLRTYLPSPFDLGVAVEYEFETPGAYTVFVNPTLPDGTTARWQDWFVARPVPEDVWGTVYYYESTERYPTFLPGQRTEIPYGKAAYGMGLKGTWQYDGSGLVTPQQFIPSGGTWLGPSQYTVGNGTIWRNGQAIGEYDFERDGYVIPPELAAQRANYTVEFANEPNFLPEVTTYGQQVHGRWSFTTEAAAPYAAIELLNARLTGPFDRLGRAEAGTKFPLTLTAGRSKPIASNVVWASVALSYDDGRTWHTLPLRKTARGTWTATVTHPATNNGFVSTRIRARDDKRGAVDFTMIRAYGLVGP